MVNRRPRLTLILRKFYPPLISSSLSSKTWVCSSTGVHERRKLEWRAYGTKGAMSMTTGHFSTTATTTATDAMLSFCFADPYHSRQMSNVTLSKVCYIVRSTCNINFKILRISNVETTAYSPLLAVSSLQNTAYTAHYSQYQTSKILRISQYSLYQTPKNTPYQVHCCTAVAQFSQHRTPKTTTTSYINRHME